MRNSHIIFIFICLGIFQTFETLATKLADQPRSEYILSPNFQISSTRVTRKYTLKVTNTTAAPDGFWRSVLAINHQIPGPLIEVSHSSCYTSSLETYILLAQSYLDRVDMMIKWV